MGRFGGVDLCRVSRRGLKTCREQFARGKEVRIVFSRETGIRTEVQIISLRKKRHSKRGSNILAPLPRERGVVYAIKMRKNSSPRAWISPLTTNPDSLASVT
jgi:hypothetical protein